MVAQLATLAERLSSEPGHVAATPAASSAEDAAAAGTSQPRTPLADAASSLPGNAGDAGQAGNAAAGPASPPTSSKLAGRPPGGGASSFGAGRLRRMTLGNAATVPLGHYDHPSRGRKATFYHL